MYFNSNNLKGMKIHATDGLIGKVEDHLFDDERWTVRYLIVNTGGFLNRHDVLISPISISSLDEKTGEINVNLTKSQIEESPDIKTHEPISRQHERLYNSHFSWPAYWGGGVEPWVIGPYGIPWNYYMNPTTVMKEEVRDLVGDEDSENLRSGRELRAYSIQARDGKFGHIESFIIDDRTWMIKYIEIDTINFFPSESVLMSPQWVDKIDWREQAISFPFSKEAIKNAPNYHGQKIKLSDEATIINYYEAAMNQLRKMG